MHVTTYPTKNPMEQKHSETDGHFKDWFDVDGVFIKGRFEDWLEEKAAGPEVQGTALRLRKERAEEATAKAEKKKKKKKSKD